MTTPAYDRLSKALQLSTIPPTGTRYIFAEYEGAHDLPPVDPTRSGFTITQRAQNIAQKAAGFSHVLMPVLQCEKDGDGNLTFVGFDWDLQLAPGGQKVSSAEVEEWVFNAGNSYLALGTTLHHKEQITAVGQALVAQNPKYNFLSNNCSNFVYALAWSIIDKSINDHRYTLAGVDFVPGDFVVPHLDLKDNKEADAREEAEVKNMLLRRRR